MEQREKPLVKKIREVTFEQIVKHVDKGDLLDIIKNPNSENMPINKYRKYLISINMVQENLSSSAKALVGTLETMRERLIEMKNNQKT